MARLITDIHANLKSGVHLSGLGPMNWFPGLNASGKSAALQAIELLIAKRASDVRGKEVAQGAALASLRDSMSDANIAGLSIDAVLNDDSIAAATFGVGRPVRSWPEGLIDESFKVDDKPTGWTHMARLTYAGFLSASPDSAAALMARLVGDASLADAAEKAAAAAKLAQAEVKKLNVAREAFREYRYYDQVKLIDKQLDEAMSTAASLKQDADEALRALQVHAAELSVEADVQSAVSPAFPRLRAKFGLPMLAGHLNQPSMTDQSSDPESSSPSGFGRSVGCPLLGLLKPESNRLDFALSGAQEAFCCLWLSQQLAEVKAAAEPGWADSVYRVFLLPDRSYDSEFIQFLAADVEEMGDSLMMQIFGAYSI